VEPAVWQLWQPAVQVRDDGISNETGLHAV